MPTARAVAAIAFLLVTAALAPAASARTADNPCRDYGRQVEGNYLNGHKLDPHISAAALARMTDHYLACGPHFLIPNAETWWVQSQTPACHHYFKVGGTSNGHTNSHTAHWDYYTYLGQYILWNGFGTWFHNQLDGNAVRFVPNLHNWNWNAKWGTQVFMHCERTHLPPD